MATVKACSRPRTRAGVTPGAAKAEVAGKSAALKSVSVRLRPRAPSMTRAGAGPQSLLLRAVQGAAAPPPAPCRSWRDGPARIAWRQLRSQRAHGACGARAAIAVQRAEAQQVDRGQQNRRAAPREERPRQGEPELAGRG